MNAKRQKEIDKIIAELIKEFKGSPEDIQGALYISFFADKKGVHASNISMVNDQELATTIAMLMRKNPNLAVTLTAAVKLYISEVIRDSSKSELPGINLN